MAVMSALHLALKRLQSLLRAREIARLKCRSDGGEPLLEGVVLAARTVCALIWEVLCERGVGCLGTRKVARLQGLCELLKVLVCRILLWWLINWSVGGNATDTHGRLRVRVVRFPSLPSFAASP
jgi:hypothetical protein